MKEPSPEWIKAFMRRVGPSMTRPCVPARQGTWKSRSLERPDLFDETGAWRPGVDKFSI